MQMPSTAKSLKSLPASRILRLHTGSASADRRSDHLGISKFGLLGGATDNPRAHGWSRPDRRRLFQRNSFLSHTFRCRLFRGQPIPGILALKHRGDSASRCFHRFFECVKPGCIRESRFSARRRTLDPRPQALQHSTHWPGTPRTQLGYSVSSGSRQGPCKSFQLVED